MKVVHSADARLIWQAIERHLDAHAVDGISAEGVYNERVHDVQKSYEKGLRAARLAAINAIKKNL